MTLDVSPSVIGSEEDSPADPDDLKDVTFEVDGQPMTASPIEFKSMSDGIDEGAVKFDFGKDGDTLTYSFKSRRRPVWGHIFVKGGESSSLINAGFDIEQSSTNTDDFIAGPDTIIPEPATSALLLTGMAALIGRRRHRL
jgi:hypothetical protein